MACRRHTSSVVSKLAYLLAIAVLSSVPACDSSQPARPTWEGDARGADVAGPEADSGPGPAAGPRIAVDPPKDLRFDNVMPGDEATRTVTVRNAGSGVLQVTGLSLSGRHVSAFSFAVAGDSPPYRLAGGEPGSYVTVEVTYRATDVTNQYAELHIFSDDPERPEVVVGLRGRPRPYCLRLSTEVLDFRTAAFGREPAEREVRLEDRGRKDIVVRSLALADGSSPDFRIGRPLRGLDDACVQDPAAACTGEAPVFGHGESSFVVEYAPQELGWDEGTVVVRTNAPGYRELEIDLMGRGTDVIPPVCLAEAGPYQGDLEVHPDWQHALRVPPCTGIRLSSAGPSQAWGRYKPSACSHGTCQPPRNSVAKTAPSRTTSTNSPSGNMANFSDEYSVA